LPDPTARVLDTLLHAALLPPRRDIAEVGLEEVVRRHRGEARVDHTPPVLARRAIDRRLHVVVDTAPGHPAQADEAAGVRVKEHLVALARIAHQPEGPRRTQLHMRQLHLPSDPADNQALFAPVELEGFAPREAEWHVRRTRGHGALIGTPGANEFGDPRIAAGKALG